MSRPGRALEPDRDRHVRTIALTAQLTGRADEVPLSPERFWVLHAELDGDLAAAASDVEVEFRQLAARTAAAALHASELETQGITLLTPFHAAYPGGVLEVLGDLAPPLLYVAGDPVVLGDPDRSRLAVVGSADASGSAVDVARTAAEAAADHGWDVVSGGAQGVDAAALNAAAQRGGMVIALRVEGVRRALRKGPLRRLVSDGRAVLASPTHPDAAGIADSLLTCSRLIHTLADVTFVAAVADGTSDTWKRAVEALRCGYGRVAVDAAAPGAEALQALGARTVLSPAALFE